MQLHAALSKRVPLVSRDLYRQFRANLPSAEQRKNFNIWQKFYQIQGMESVEVSSNVVDVVVVIHNSLMRGVVCSFADAQVSTLPRIARNEHRISRSCASVKHESHS